MNLFSNYTRIYFRRFRKELGHYLVNIMGLGLGFSILFFILLFVVDEQNMDAYHTKSDRVYRVVTNIQEEDGQHQYLSVSGALAPALKNDFSQVEEVAHLTYFGSQVLGVGDNLVADREWALATRSIFDILDFEVVSGDLRKDAGQVGLVLTEEMAKRLFGETDVVGKIVDESNFDAVEVIAVIKEMPRNSSYQFNNIYVVDSYDSFGDRWLNFINAWQGRFAQTWVLLKPNTSPEDIYAKKGEFLDKYLDEEMRETYDFSFQNIADMHLGSTGIETGGMNPRLTIPYSSHEFVTMILMMGFLVIFIAALNYVNLSSVQALKRTLEASMRKINGAQNNHLIIQLFYETLLTIMFSYGLASLLIFVSFPFFREITGKELPFAAMYTGGLITYHIAAVLLIWTCSALIPALYYSKLKRSLLILKNAFSGKGDMLRKVLVGIQYALSIFLIIGSLVIYRQLDYIHNKNLGFSNENLIVMDINSGAARSSFKEIINGIKSNSSILNASTSSRVPGEWKNIPSANMAKTLGSEPVEVSHYAIDKNWIDTYKMSLKDGSNFTGNDKTDSLSIIVNDATASLLELENPIGESVWVMSRRDSVKMRIVGVIEDFHYESMYQPIGPVVLTNWNNHVLQIDYFTIRYQGDPSVALEHIEAVNDKFDPTTPAELNFLDDQWERFYKSEESRATIILIASVVSILISAFGLFGLINFTVERKTKEIGIRKVMGASIPNIIQIVLKDYLVLLLIALIVAAPVSWWLFKDWLSDFAYRINLSADIFIIAFIAVLVISFATVLSRIFKVAKANPVNSIRYE